MPRRVCHILGSAGHEGTGIANIILALKRHTDPVNYEISACFVGEDGPLVQAFSDARIPTTRVKWKHPSRDITGALNLLNHLRTSRFDVVHFHWGGPSLRRLARFVTKSKVVFHL